MTEAHHVRPCAVCGLFYPADPDNLRNDIEGLLDRVPPKQLKGRIRGLILPHAGYMYSGYTAAHACVLLRGADYPTIVIVSPSHREYFEGASIYPGDSYQTPLGEVPINDTLREVLVKETELVKIMNLGHRDEHAVEVELPFLQQVLKEFSFLPIVIGDQKRETCFELGKALANVLKSKDVLLVASTDLSHYYPSTIAHKLDSVMINDVSAFNYERLMADLETGLTEACGGGPTVAVLAALSQLGANKIEVLHHCNSGDITGDYRSVVGYLSAVAHD